VKTRRLRNTGLQPWPFAIPFFLFLLASLAGAQTPQNPFAQRFVRSMEYIDYPDILVAIAAGNDRTWERYDDGERHAGRTSSLESRWARATALGPSGAAASQVLALHSVFAESGGGFRETPIDDAGGDIDRGSGGPGGFDRLTLEQAQALKANPLLVVEIRPDPYNQATPGQTVLARYRYPSAATFHRFEQLLSPGLRAELQTAEQSGQLRYDPWNAGSVGPSFRRLNPRIIAELLDAAYRPSDPPWQNYQRMIAVHPFDDYNGRTLRAWYRRQAARPMFMLDFYCDLYCSTERFGQEIRTGDEIGRASCRERVYRHV
jgi:hypothetical protein